MMFASLLLAMIGFRPADDPGYITDAHERPAAETDKAYAGMKPIAYTPPVNRWENLPRTRKRLQIGGELRVVMLGDSIVHDTSRSNWDLLLPAVHPKLKVHRTIAVRGNTGCWYYKEPGKVQRFVLDHKPDLVLIGGISHRDDVDSIREVVRQIKARSDADIVLMTGPFGFLDPLNDGQWKQVVEAPADSFRVKLAALAKEQKLGFLDMQTAWGEYVRASGQPVTKFKRDAVHANLEGEQIIGRVLARYLTPED